LPGDVPAGIAWTSYPRRAAGRRLALGRALDIDRLGAHL